MIYTEPTGWDFWQLAEEPGSSTYLDPLGPRDCMTHSAARAVMRATEGVRPAGTSGAWPPTGYGIRRHCLDDNGVDVTGGVNHTEVRAAVARMYDVALTPYYANSFDDMVDLAAETRGVMASLWYKRIRDSVSRRGSFTFYQNHEIFIGGVDRARSVFTHVVDPLADGRQAGLYHGPGEYSFALIRGAMGELNISSTSTYRAVGAGRGYFMVTRATGDRPVAWWPSWAPTPPAAATFSITVAAGKTFKELDSDARYIRTATTAKGFTAYGNSRTRRASGAVIGRLITTGLADDVRGGTYVDLSIGTVRSKT